MSARLPGSQINPELVALLVARGAGNPFTTLEYLHALVNAGALNPSWDGWRLDTELLRTLQLPDDVLDLVLARIDGLGVHHHRILVTAAAVGTRFRPGLVAAALGVECDLVLAAVREAVDQRLVETAGPVAVDAEIGFVHDRIREALLHSEGEAELRRVHQRIAEALDGSDGGDARQVYAVALHYAAGEPERTPQRVFHTGWAAGRLALTENAVAAAVSFLEPARAAASGAGIEPDSAFWEALGQAYLRTGRLDAAERELRQALNSERDPLRRASLLVTLSIAQRGAWDIVGAVASCRQGLVEIGHRTPRNPVVLLGSTLSTVLLAATIGRLRLSGSQLAPEKRERLRLQAALNLAAAHSCGVGIVRPMMPIFNARAAWPSARLGPSRGVRTGPHRVGDGAVRSAHAPPGHQGVRPSPRYCARGPRRPEARCRGHCHAGPW